ncbi:hypothetical protein EGR_04111 [Echinococcus granulosus]|uniref:Uncharacterized protein n=1 Tax=Echinococcus granulosus TaxID=6210 RepID=W6UJ69_ECHGR|nr:hypothetical protein EGR_04111 [Echinococcus granulosus]EUB61078.1 hypothetical protein EGR_04111 [Echinococcus granulosus]
MHSYFAFDCYVIFLIRADSDFDASLRESPPEGNSFDENLAAINYCRLKKEVKLPVFIPIREAFESHKIFRVLNRKQDEQFGVGDCLMLISRQGVGPMGHRLSEMAKTKRCFQPTNFMEAGKKPNALAFCSSAYFMSLPRCFFNGDEKPLGGSPRLI